MAGRMVRARLAEGHPVRVLVLALARSPSTRHYPYPTKPASPTSSVILRREYGLQSGQAVDALDVLARPVGRHLRLPLALGRLHKFRARSYEFHEWYPETARTGHPLHPPLPRRRLHKFRARSYEFHEWYPETARTRNPIYRHVYEGPRSGQARESGTQLVVNIVARLMNLAQSVEANHLWRAVEGAEHQRDASVCLQMGYRLHAAACEVAQGEAARAGHGGRV